MHLCYNVGMYSNNKNDCILITFLLKLLLLSRRLGPPRAVSDYSGPLHMSCPVPTYGFTLLSLLSRVAYQTPKFRLHVALYDADTVHLTSG